jgi:STE24 endopeptidase
MQLFVLLIMIGAMAGDQAISPAPPLGHWPTLALVLASHGLAAAVSVIIIWLARRRLERQPGRAGQIVSRTDRKLSIVRLLVAGLFYFHVFSLGWATLVNDWLGGLILINIVLMVAPPLGVVVISWWAYYPIDRRLREAMLIRQIDSGQPVYPIWSRRQYMLSQLRHQFLLLLLPLLALLTWAQVVDRIGLAWPALREFESAILVLGGAGLFMLAPLMIRHVWDTIVLPEGELRDRLLAMCSDLKIKVRQLLLWRTYGGMINGAVMGLVGPLRYILLTDALVDQMPTGHVEAVMAHELGHIKRRHMPWMIICASATLGTIGLVIDLLAFGAAWVGFELATIGLLWPIDGGWSDGWAEQLTVAPILLAAVGLWALVFGFISRRFERQADTFAVQYLSQRQATAGSDEKRRISSDAVHQMIGALHNVAHLNHLPVRKRSWRHGSIEWRINYLQTLVGRRIDGCPIDQKLRMIRWGCAGLLAAVVFSGWLLHGR